VEWIDVTDSTRVVAVAYNPDSEEIYVRFPDGIEWCYRECPPAIWEEFVAAGASKGQYIHEVLNGHPNGRC
jgi:KTSC domain